MKIVLDTNVIVSGLLSPHGAPGEIVRMVSSGQLSLCYDARIMAEYAEVLARPEFGFDPEAIQAFLDEVRGDGLVVAPGPVAQRLPDPDDESFLAAALAGEAICLVTGNARHFPAARRQGMKVLAPAAFLEGLRKGME